MAALGAITVEIRMGPMLLAASELHARAEEVAELIPEWHAAERDAFLEACRRFEQACAKHLTTHG